MSHPPLINGPPSYSQCHTYIYIYMCLPSPPKSTRCRRPYRVKTTLTKNANFTISGPISTIHTIFSDFFPNFPPIVTILHRFGYIFWSFWPFLLVLVIFCHFTIYAPILTVLTIFSHFSTNFLPIFTSFDWFWQILPNFSIKIKFYQISRSRSSFLSVEVFILNSSISGRL